MTAVVDTIVEAEHVLRVPNSSGDLKLSWRVGDDVAIAAARAAFEAAIAGGASVFVIGSGESGLEEGTRLTEFNETVAESRAVPQHAGG